MEKHYFSYYKRYYKNTQKLIIALIILIVACMGLILGVEIFFGDGGVDEIIETGMNIIFIIIPVFIILGSLFSYCKRFIKLWVTLTENEIIYRDSHGGIKIPIGEIQRIEISSMTPQFGNNHPYLKTSLRIVSTNGVITLNMFLQDIADLTKQLKDLIDKRDMQNIYDEKEMLIFLKTTTGIEQNRQRQRDLLKSIKLGVVFCIVTGILCKLFNLEAVMRWIIGGAIIVPMLLFFSSSVILDTKVNKQLLDPAVDEIKPRDKNYERKVFGSCFAVSLIVYFIIAVLWIR